MSACAGVWPRRRPSSRSKKKVSTLLGIAPDPTNRVENA